MSSTPLAGPSKPRTIEDLIEAALAQAATSSFTQEQRQSMAKRLTQLVIARAGSEPLMQLAQTLSPLLGMEEPEGAKLVKLAQTGNIYQLNAMLSEAVLEVKGSAAQSMAGESGVSEALMALAASAGRCLSALIDDREAAASYAKKLFSIVSSGAVDPGRVLAVSRDLDELAKAQREIRVKLEENTASVKKTLQEVLGQAAEAVNVIESSSEKMEREAAGAASAGSLEAMKSALGAIVNESAKTVEQVRETKISLHEKEERIAGAQKEIDSLKRQLVEMSRMVQEDPLTGALNRRGLESAAKHELAQAKRFGAFCLGLVDLDNFKSFNDTFGHAAGDEALKHFAKCARMVLRKGDLLARMGGEEFVILMPKTQLKEAYLMFERISVEVAKPFLGRNVTATPDSVLLTFSAGLTLLGDEDTVESVIHRADELMYKAKTTGKAKTCVG